MSEIMGLAENGLLPQDIASKLLADHGIDKDRVDNDEPVVFSDGVHMISQALAYRVPVESDYDEIKSLINASFVHDISGEYAFREPPGITNNIFDSLFDSIIHKDRSSSYHWLIVEAPNGYDIEKDGIILGVCCYTTDGVARNNHEIEGHLGSIRLFCVLPKYQRLCIGRRFLSKIEYLMMHPKIGVDEQEKNTKHDICVRSMICLPYPDRTVIDVNGKEAEVPRSYVHEWVERMGYKYSGSLRYPSSIGHVILDEIPIETEMELKRKAGNNSKKHVHFNGNVELLVYLKAFDVKKQEFYPVLCDPKETKSNMDMQNLPRVPSPNEQKPILPPQWRSKEEQPVIRKQENGEMIPPTVTYLKDGITITASK